MLKLRCRECSKLVDKEPNKALSEQKCPGCGRKGDFQTVNTG